MYKAIKDNKIIAIANKKVGYMIVDDVKQEVELTPESYFPLLNYDEIVEDTEHTADDYDQYNGEYILKEDYPVDARNEEIRQQRQARYEAESDPIRLDYDEALAREQDNAETLKQEWLASKDKIREELPYIVTQE